MFKIKKKKKHFTGKELKTINTIEHGEKNRTVLRVVKWENSKKPVLENRRFYWNIDYDEWRPMRLAPIGKEEFKIILEHSEEIMKIFGEYE